MFIEGFEEQIIGLKVGDHKTIKVTFPKVYPSKEVAGKDAEFDIKVNSIKAQKTMSEEEINGLREDASKVEEIRNELKEDAVNSVKATFIVDALAKAENVEVSDQEVMQVLYYEALQMGQNPKDVLKQYEEAGYLPAIKMSMIEEKVISKLLDDKLAK